MGPRRFRRGCITPEQGVGISREGFNGAATFPSRMSSPGPSAIARRYRFNGAATFPSRMFTLVAIAERLGVRLQWGRDVSVADVCVRGRHEFLRCRRFNGAATFPSRM